MPNLEALTAKVDLTGDLGETYDQMLQAAEREAYGREGAEKVLKAAAKLVLKLHEHVDKDLEEDNLPKQELQIAGYAKRYVTLASESLLNLAEKMEAEKFVAHGKLAALKSVVAVVQRHHDSAVTVKKQVETELSQAVAGQELNGDARPTVRGAARASGQHPGPSSLEERRAKGKRLKAERQAKESDQANSTEEPVESKKTNGAPKRKKPKARKRAKASSRAES